jgi:hypothetical protein
MHISAERAKQRRQQEEEEREKEKERARQKAAEIASALAAKASASPVAETKSLESEVSFSIPHRVVPLYSVTDIHVGDKIP